MLIYNDQKKSIDEQNEKLYTSFIPEDNFWRKMKKNTNFSLICELFKKSDSTEDEEQTVRLFKCLLLKTYYELSDEDLVEKIVTDMTFRYFLDLDPLKTDSIETADLASFRTRPLNLEIEYIDHLLKKAIAEDTVPSQKEESNSRSYLNEFLTDTVNSANDKQRYTIEELAVIFLNTLKRHFL